MSVGGTDNPAFSNDECHTSDNSNSTLENSHTESLQNSQITVESDYRTPIDEASSAANQKIENGHQQSFVSQHYVEPIRTSPEPQYKTETRIELPADNQEKIPSPTKSNGVHGNGNNNDASFLNTSTASIQSNDGKKEQVEAVNLELVSMRPYSGANAQTKGQEACEVPADPYEEYFVPVNEHRKYIRGEKLYVTKDKRSRSSYWRRILCWGCGLLVLALAVIIAILAATGVILTQEATQPLESDDHTSSRQFSDIKTSGSQEYVRNPPTSPPPEASSFSPWPTTDETPYEIIPKALEGKLTLDDLTWTEDLDDPKSRVYRDVSQEIETNLKDMLHLAENLSVVKVYNISRDGEVKFRISYPPVPTPEQMQINIEKMLQKSGSMVGKYHLSKLNIAHLIDECKSGQLNCSESCRYDYVQGMFICSCFPGKILQADGVTCQDENDLSNVDMDDEMPHEQSTEFVQYGVQGRSRGPETTFNPKHQELDLAHPQSEETTEIDQITARVPQVFEQPEPQPTGGTKYEPEPSSEPKSELEPTSEPNSEPEPSIEHTSGPSSSPDLEPKVEPAAEPKAEPEPSVEPEPTAEPKSEPEPTTEPKSEPEPSVEPELTAEPKSEPEPTTETKSESEPSFEPASEPEPKSETVPSSEPKSEPEPSSEPASEPEPKSEPESSSEPKSEPEPSSEPNSEPTPSTELSIAPHSKGEPTPELESTAEPQPVAEINPSAEPNSEPVPSVEPISEPQPSSEPELEPAMIGESKTESSVTVQSKPVSETPIISVESSDQYNTAMHTHLSDEITTESFTELPNMPGLPAEPIHESDVPWDFSKDVKSDTPTVTSLSKSDDKFEKQTEPNLLSGPILHTDQNSSIIEGHNQTQPIVPVTESKLSQNEFQFSAVPSVEPLFNVENSREMSRGFNSDNNDTVFMSHPQLHFENSSHSEPETEPHLIPGTKLEVPQVESSMGDFVASDNLTNHLAPSTNQSDLSKAIRDSKANSTIAQEIPLAPVTEIVQSGESGNKMETNAGTSEQPQWILGPTVESRSKAIPDYDSFFDGGMPTTTVEPAHNVFSGFQPMPFETTIEPLASVEPGNVNENNGQIVTTNEMKHDNVSVSPESIADISNVTESLLTKMNTSEIKAIEEIPSTSTDEEKLQDTTEYNVIDHMPSTIYQTLPKLIGEDVEPLIEPVKNTTNSEDQHIMIISNTEHVTEYPVHSMIPELLPEPISSNLPTENSVHNDSMFDNIPMTNDAHSTGEGNPISTLQVVSKPTTIQPEHNVITEHPSYPIVFAENSVEHHSDKIELSDEKREEVMSPYLPDTQREKEIFQKGPRLDNDEQDVPNPFETRIPDVIAHHSKESGNNTKLQIDPSSTEFNGVLDEVHEIQNDTASDPAIATEINSEINMNQESHSVEDKRNQVPVIMTGLVAGDTLNNLEQNLNVTEVPVENFRPINSQNDSVHAIGNAVNGHDFHEDDVPQVQLYNVKHAFNDSTSTDLGNQNQTVEVSPESDEALRVIPLGANVETSDDIPIKLDSYVLSDEKNIEHSEKSVVDYTERNFEDQYNDITDEADSNLTKHFKSARIEQDVSNIPTSSDNSTLSNAQDATIAQAQDNVNFTKNIQTSTEQSTEHNEVSHSAYSELNGDVPATTQNSVELSSKDPLYHLEATTAESISSLETTMLPEIIRHDHFNEAKLTTEVPILPVEIEQSIFVTETSHKDDQIAITENHVDQQSNDTHSTIVLSDAENSTVTLQPSTSTHGPNFESNTTVQIPILPDEFQTTENEIFVTTPSVKMEQNDEKPVYEDAQNEQDDDKYVISDNSQVNQETANNEFRIIQNASTPILNVATEAYAIVNGSTHESLPSEEHTTIGVKVAETVTSFNETGILQANLTNNENTEKQPHNDSMHSENVQTNLETPVFSSGSVDTQRENGIRYTTQSSMRITDDIRPVSEAVIDDFNPFEFDYKQRFISTEKTQPVTEEELSDEELRVIPLEKQEIKKKIVEKKSFDKYKHKKEKELSFEDRGNTSQPIHDSEIPTTTMLSVEIPPAIVTNTMEKETVVEEKENLDGQMTLVNISSTPAIIMDDAKPNSASVSEGNSDEMTSVSNTSEAVTPRTDSETHLVDNETHIHTASVNNLVSQAEEASQNTENKTIEEVVKKDDNLLTSSSTPIIETEIRAAAANTSEILDAQIDINATMQNAMKSFIAQDIIEGNDTKINVTQLPVHVIEQNPIQYNIAVNEPTLEMITGILKNETSDVQNPRADSMNENIEQISGANQQSVNQGVNSNTSSDITSGLKNTDDMAERPTTPVGSTEIPTSFIENLPVDIPIQLPNLLFSKCTAGQFQCVNGTSRDGAYCVSLAAKCDSENDCSDGSDEVNCEEEGCPGNFQCSNGQCLKRHLVCNGIQDCDDGSDEKSCEAWKCQYDEFQCPNGRCIPILWQCNGRPDCENHRDEYSCAESCGNNEYLCPTEKWCIPLTWHCNGIPECANGEDEKLCDCALDQFKCQTGGCVSLDLVCDGIEHCPDHSDEWDCLVANLTIAQAQMEIQKDDDNDAHEDTDLIGRATILKIRQPNGERRLVCSDNWTTELSDSFCKAQGYFSSESTEMLPLTEAQKLLKLKSKPDTRAPLVTNLEHADICGTGKIVQISCQEFSCGSHYPEGPTARLAGGTPAGEGQWSSVALLKEQKHGTACTASVVSPMHVLASYSCIHKYRQSTSWQLFTDGDMLIPHAVKNIVPYPQVKYNQFLYNNDMALVELEEPLTFSRNVSAVCLPNHPIQARQLCVTAGWGFPMNGEINLQQYLTFLPVPIYDSAECNATSHYAGFITKDNICAGFTDTDKGPCYNDEGAPLMCVSESGRWELQGLLSHHSRCSRGHPAIYSSLAPALSWLHHSIPALQGRP